MKRPTCEFHDQDGFWLKTTSEISAQKSGYWKILYSILVFKTCQPRWKKSPMREILQKTKLATGTLGSKSARQTWSLCPVWRSRGSCPPYIASQLLKKRKSSTRGLNPVPVLIRIQLGQWIRKNNTPKRKKKRMLHVMKHGMFFLEDCRLLLEHKLWNIFI